MLLATAPPPSQLTPQIPAGAGGAPTSTPVAATLCSAEPLGSRRPPERSPRPDQPPTGSLVLGAGLERYP